jgi:hypothetical protein
LKVQDSDSEEDSDSELVPGARCKAIYTHNYSVFDRTEDFLGLTFG